MGTVIVTPFQILFMVWQPKLQANINVCILTLLQRHDNAI